MLKSTIAAASLALGLGLAASAASAAPSFPFAPGAASAAEKVAVVCTWRDGRWGYMRGKAFVIMPKTVQLSEAVKGIMPVGVRDFIADKVLGIYHTMDDFQGRPDQQA